MNGATKCPSYFWLLSDADRIAYNFLHSYLSNNPESSQRNKRVKTFADSLTMIKAFCIRGDQCDKQRCIACGVFWVDGERTIAINTYQLSILMAKCKSSINGSLQLLGYGEPLKRKNASDLVGDYLLQIKNDRGELRKWTIRSLIVGEKIKSVDGVDNENMTDNNAENAEKVDTDEDNKEDMENAENDVIIDEIIDDNNDENNQNECNILRNDDSDFDMREADEIISKVLDQCGENDEKGDGVDNMWNIGVFNTDTLFF